MHEVIDAMFERNVSVADSFFFLAVGPGFPRGSICFDRIFQPGAFLTGFRDFTLSTARG